MKRTPIISLAALPTIAFLGVVGTGCTHHQRDAVSETVVRNVVATESAKKFHDAGHPIEGGLTCTSAVDGKKISVSCHGKTTTGAAATVVGAGTLTDSDTTVRGTWKGLIGSKQTFAETCLGAKC